MNTDCIEWQKAKTSAGYGKKYHNGKICYVHRLAAEEKYGDITGKVVRHTCDNPSCYNPDHLLIGTQADNMRDKKERGRAYRGGPNNPHRELSITDEQIIMVERLRQEGWKQPAIANECGIHQSTVSRILNNKIRRDGRASR